MKVLLAIGVVAALAFAVPAQAGFTGVCNPDPYVCLGVLQGNDGTDSSTFVVAETKFAAAVAGTESDPSSGYTLAGACGGTLIAAGCVVVIELWGHHYLLVVTPAGCNMIALDGGAEDWC